MSSTVPLDFKMEVQGDAEVQSKFQKTGDAADQLGQKTDKAAKSADGAAKSYFNAAGGIASAASGIGGLVLSYGDLEKRELAIQSAEAQVNSAHASLISAQQALTKLTDAGTTSGAAYEQAQLRVQAAEQQLDIAHQKVQQSQGDLSDAQTQFALGVIPTVFSAITGLTGVMDLLKGSQVAMRLATALGITTSGADAVAKGAQAAATGAAATATDGLALSTRLLNLAMGPVGIAILGVSAFMALFATNAFGIRDAINAAGKAIGDAIPILRPLLDMLGGLANTLFPQAKESTTDFSKTASDQLAQVKDQYPGMVQEQGKWVEASSKNEEELLAQYNKLHAGTSSTLTAMTTDTNASVATQKASYSDLSNSALQMGQNVGQGWSMAASAAASASARIQDAAAKASAAMRSIGAAGSGASAAPGGSGIITAANGYNGNVTSPTIFLAGEAGPEHVNIAPVGAASSVGGGGGGPINITVVTTLDGQEVARTVSKYQARGL